MLGVVKPSTAFVAAEGVPLAPRPSLSAVVSCPSA